MRDYIIYTIIGLYVLNLTLPVIAGFVSLSVNHWNRGRTNKSYFTFIQKYKYSIHCREDLFIAWCLIDGLVIGLLSLLLVFSAIHLPMSVLSWAAVTVVCAAVFFFVPRFIVDLNHTLRMKKGDSERLRELQDQIDELKGATK